MRRIKGTIDESSVLKRHGGAGTGTEATRTTAIVDTNIARQSSGNEHIFVVLVVLLGHSEPERSPHAPLSASAPKVAAAEVLEIGRVDGPVVAFAVRRSTRLHEAVVEREVVADRVAPARASVVEVRVVVQDVLVDVAENESLFRR